MAIALKFGAVAFLLFALLFADSLLFGSENYLGFLLREAAAILRDSGTQWMVFLCLGIYFTAFLFFRFRRGKFCESPFSTHSILGLGPPVFTHPMFWLACALLINAVVYAFNYSPSIRAITLLAGAVLGQGAAVWTCFEMRNQKSEVRNSFGGLVVSVLVLLLTLASVWNMEPNQIFEYRGHGRWSGPWDNPNIFGLLMGVGTILAVGLIVSGVKCQVSGENDGEIRTWKLRNGKYLKWLLVMMCLFAAILMGRGLLQSYSRGAWLAAICGLGYLVCQVFRCQGSSVARWVRANVLFVTVIMFSVFVLAFWQFQHAEHRHVVAQRVFSVANANDFSWRNRIDAWEGTLQIMAEHPMLGAGWNQPERMYDNYYRQVKVDEATAVQLNDYFMLGATVGVPALFCFGMYIWLSLTQESEVRNWKSAVGIKETEIENWQDACPTLDSGLWTLNWLQTTCRAGAIVLLIGFWFDGGLFNLPTASMFWILLELGSARLTPAKIAVPS